VATLVEGDDPPSAEMTSEAIPVARIGAQAVEQEHRRLAVRASITFPLDIVEADAISLEPSVDWFTHPESA
jgi:hypothetical protein